jgi:hypothetical protein
MRHEADTGNGDEACAINSSYFQWSFGVHSSSPFGQGDLPLMD